MIDDRAAEFNKIFIDLLNTDRNKAQDAMADYGRVYIWEGSITHKILPGVSITEEEAEKERHVPPGSYGWTCVEIGDSPLATGKGPTYQMQFGTLSSSPVTVTRAQLANLTASQEEDARYVILDPILSEMTHELDSNFFSALNSIVGDEQPWSEDYGLQNVRHPGPINRESLLNTTKILPSLSQHLLAYIMVCNDRTLDNLLKLSPEEEPDLERVKLQDELWVITNKYEVVPNSVFYHFTKQNFLGKHHVLDNFYVRIEEASNDSLTFTGHIRAAIAIDNPHGFCRVRFEQE